MFEGTCRLRASASASHAAAGRRREHELEKREDRGVNEGSTGLRLQKILSQAGVASRRAAEKLIAQGRVSVNGKTMLQMGVKADPAVDDVRVDGRRITSAERLRYILLY